MNRYPDPSHLQQQARALRREALAGIAEAVAIKWKALLDAASNAPHPRKGPTPSHP
jgi:hypothetical protein